jgi:hypothetical protein
MAERYADELEDLGMMNDTCVSIRGCWTAIPGSKRGSSS